MYFILYSFLYLISLLPLRVLYVLSDVFSFILFRVIGYRRKIIHQNIAIAFPHKTWEERKKIVYKFHRNFTDTFIETIKCLSVGEKFYNKHCTADFTVFNKLKQEGLSCQLHGCHQFNWEWINLHISLYAQQTFLVIYMPITNKLLDKLFYKIRSRFGSVLLSATDIKNSFVKWRNKLHILALIADQTPATPASGYWLNFFSKPTPFLIGPEKNAVIKKEAVVFGKIVKKGRGKYATEFELICTDASQLKQGELTNLYRDYVEKTVAQQPELYLWSHRRWKWDYKTSYKDKWIDNKATMPV